jgi:diguanylate cyclase (GGDEF)-like protein/PAS domain S-box-containing protein
MENNPVASVFLDDSGLILTCNPAFEKLFGYTRNEVIGMLLDPLIAAGETLDQAKEYTRALYNDEATIRVTARRRRKDGSMVDVEIQGVPISLDDKHVGVLGLYHDISEQKRAEEETSELFKSFVNIMDGLDADVYVADLVTYEILFMNKHMIDGFNANHIGRICYEAFREDSTPCEHCSNSKIIDSNGNPLGVYVWEGKNPITKRWYKNSDRVIPWRGGKYVRMQIATDITELKEAEERLSYLATHDPLTGLPNRLLFQDRLIHAINVARRKGNRLGVLFIDLDNFKAINDRYGHHTGDLLLKAVAVRLRSTLRESDTLARVSGDEFTVILEDFQTEDQTIIVAEKLRDTIRDVFKIEGNEIKITATIGISEFPQHSQDAGDLLRLADEAMYSVKAGGKDGYAKYHG